jgi:hypothetical protein
MTNKVFWTVPWQTALSTSVASVAGALPDQGFSPAARSVDVGDDNGQVAQVSRRGQL